jgi:hypothetical protein
MLNNNPMFLRGISKYIESNFGDLPCDKIKQEVCLYFNADTRGAYRIVVEGIDSDGNIGMQVYKYEVK